MHWRTPAPRKLPEFLTGSFTAHIPLTLAAAYLRHFGFPDGAAGFPAMLRYSSVRRGLIYPNERTFIADYRPRFETFIYADACRKMTYEWIPNSAFHIDVLHNGETGEWNVYKFRSGTLVSHSFGRNYSAGMIATTRVGLAPDEPAFTFVGDPEECNHENAVQRERAVSSDGELVLAYNALPTSDRVLVFGIVPRACGTTNLVFIPLEKAHELAAIWDAVNNANTWGEFKLRMPTQRLAELLSNLCECCEWPSFDEYFAENAREDTREERERRWAEYEALRPGERPPFDIEPFDIELIPGLCDGDWPEWAEQKMFDWLPGVICQGYGERQTRRLSGNYVVLDVSRAPEIIAAIEVAGFECRWEEDLIRKACAC